MPYRNLFKGVAVKDLDAGTVSERGTGRVATDHVLTMFEVSGGAAEDGDFAKRVFVELVPAID